MGDEDQSYELTMNDDDQSCTNIMSDESYDKPPLAPTRSIHTTREGEDPHSPPPPPTKTLASMAKSFLEFRAPEERGSHGLAESRYLLPADEFESIRLEFQHNFLRHCMGNKLLLAPLDLKHLGGQSVLDSGTGTGSWIRDLFGELLEAKILEDSLIGIDITDKQFWVPDREDEQLATISYSHLKLLIANVCSLPEDWSSKFKLVHQRLLVAALTRQEWGRCVREISRVLQPGGWVQLAEVGNADFTTPLASEWVQLGRALFDARGLVWDLKPLLTELLSEAGLTDIRVQHFELPLSPTHHGSEGMQGATNFIEVYRGVKALMVKMFPERFHGDPAEYDKLLTGMTREWDESGATMPFFVIVARKPSA